MYPNRGHINDVVLDHVLLLVLFVLLCVLSLSGLHFSSLSSWSPKLSFAATTKRCYASRGATQTGLCFPHKSVFHRNTLMWMYAATTEKDQEVISQKKDVHGRVPANIFVNKNTFKLKESHPSSVL